MKKTSDRRSFLKTGAAFAAATVVLSTDSVSALAAQFATGPGLLTASKFEASADKPFYVFTDSGRLAATVAEVRSLPISTFERLPKTIRREAFEVRIAFDGDALPQGTYDCASADLGGFQLFLVPTGQPDADGRQNVIATFNHYLPNNRRARLAEG